MTGDGEVGAVCGCDGGDGGSGDETISTGTGGDGMCDGTRVGEMTGGGGGGAREHDPYRRCGASGIGVSSGMCEDGEKCVIRYSSRSSVGGVSGSVTVTAGSVTGTSG